MGDMFNNNSLLYRNFPDVECNYKVCKKNCIRDTSNNV